MHRNALKYLEKWLLESDRKPLIIRGARQVGKTWLVRAFAEKQSLKMIEINFERDPHLVSLFQTNDLKAIWQNLEAYFGTTIDLASSLVFLDEIQEAPELLEKLRWFYEELPALPIIAAGSLLEFMLQKYEYHMPVGRLTYLHLEPLSFEEFLEALGHAELLRYIQTVVLPFDIPLAIHQKLQEIFGRYMFVGGMPAVVAHWSIHRSLEKVIRMQHDLLTTYRDDFFKYRGRIDVDKLDVILRAVPQQLSRKFSYVEADGSIQATTGRQILSLFNKARLCHSVYNTQSNGIPLNATIKEKFFKEIFLDVGLAGRLLGITMPFLKTIAEGGMAEQVVGQGLRTLFPFYQNPSLYYWQRDKAGSQAEVDYLIEHPPYVVPIEVKAGMTGRLRSLHLFMTEKNLPWAIRINDDKPSIMTVTPSNGAPFSYKLLSLPFYLMGQIHRLLECVKL